MKWLLVFVVALVAVVSIYVGLPWIIEAVIVRQAAALGVSVNELQIQRPSWGRLRVDRIAVGMGANQIQAVEVSIGFTLDSLLSFQATHVAIESLNVLANVVDSGTSEPIRVGELVGALPAMLASTWELVPAQTFVAPEVRVEFDDVSFSGTMEFSQQAASLRGRVDGLPPLAPLQIEARLEPGGSLRAEVREEGAADNVLEIEADLAGARGTLAGSWALKLEADDGPIDLSLHGSAPIVLSEVGWVVNSGLAVAMETDAWRATLDITGAEGSWQAEPERLGRVTGRWEGSLQLDSAALSAEGGVSILIGGADLQLAFDAASVVNATGVVGEEWSIAAARIELTDGAVLQVELEPLAFRFDSPARLAVQLDRLFWSEYTLSPFVDLTVQQLHGDLASITTALQMHIPALQMGATAQVAGNLPGGPFTIGFDAEQLVAEPFFANLFPGEVQIYDLDAGRINSQGKLQLDAESGELAGKIALSLNDLSAHYEEVTIDGINGELIVVVENGDWRIGPDRVEVALADVGFPVTDLAASVSLTTDRLLLATLTGRTLGGDIAVDSMAYDIDAGSSDFILQAVGIQLADVLALEGETITGNGTLDGQLPLQIRDDEIRVAGGQLSARAPGGVLSYGGAAEAAAALNQPGVGFAIAALGDFRFGVLDVGVTYEPNGDLQLGIHLEGRNPEFENGRAIHYNLNISENIPMLLRSLQLTDEVGKQLQKRLEN